MVSAREASGNEEDLAEAGERHSEGQEPTAEEGDVDPQPHLAPVPLPRPLLTPSSIPTRVKEKSTRERVTRPSISTRLGGTSARPAARREKTRVWVWDWKARVRIRECEAGSGESVEFRVFLVAARELYENQELVLSPSRSNTKPLEMYYRRRCCHRRARFPRSQTRHSRTMCRAPPLPVQLPHMHTNQE